MRFNVTARLMMYANVQAANLLPLLALNMSVALLSMQGQKALGFNKNTLICVPKMNEGFVSLERHES